VAAIPSKSVVVRAKLYPTHIIALIKGDRAVEAIEPARLALERQGDHLGEKHYETA
jgi:hypothetical protein